MAVVVQKYGGTSVDGPERLARVAERLVSLRRTGVDVLAVVSAMGHTTDEMIRLAQAINPSPPQRELDMLVTAGERMAMALLAMAIHALGEQAISFTGSQSGIITSSAHGNARIVEVRPVRLRESLAEGKIVIVAGYQGVSAEKEVTTLGRGGSDLTAVALADAFRARCELCKDVPGILTADPRWDEEAVSLAHVSAHALIALARAGSTVVYEEAARFALEKEVPLVVRSSFDDAPGTQVTLVDRANESAYAVAVSLEPEPVVTLVATPACLDAFDAHTVGIDEPGERRDGYGVSFRSGTLDRTRQIVRLLHRRVVLPSLAGNRTHLG